MESESSQPLQTPEHFVPSGPERAEKVPLRTPENTGPLGGAERYEQRGESGARTSDGSSATLPPPLPLTPTVQAPGASSQAGVITSDDNPPIANDDDLIEKEWVDKAKKIIVDTKDDPYRREEAVSRLQRDYLEKRYGRKIGSAEDGA